ncbi:MAG TPA: hypothetical protein DCX06_06065 [Opitutae bacterium]|nr:hypothetical protein [Opitutae bacterium]
MWTITSFNVADAIQLYACDGKAVLNAGRSEDDGICRIVFSPIGYIDFSSQAKEEGGLTYFILTVNGQQINYTSDLSVTISISGSNFTVTGPEGPLTGAFTPFPELTGTTINNFQQMIDTKIVPYQDPPSGTPKSTAELQALAAKYFPENGNGYYLAMALYDWTSSSFIRQDLFNQLQYTGVVGKPLDLVTISRVIWGCNYPGYSVKDANFMNQFMMTPANSLEDVYTQLQGVQAELKPLAESEMAVYSNAVVNLAPPSVEEYPYLYRGAMSMSGGYNTGDFSPSMFEFEGNNGPTFMPLYQAFSEALEGIFKPGSIITTKGPWSFSNDLAGAKVWQNGILITLRPPVGAKVWPGCANITEFSLNPGTFEIDMAPPTRYRIEGYEWTTIKDKPVCHITMTLLGYCVEPM